ncbi:RluA family pseudouridine synthase [Paenibacillus glufosinatiresistens]|uniref:RluA family pseudouridine synthase n=1 Tax=Paenibacillus glufosinatiresistens TaxID=3070657 RepID=UPI00286D8B06|nr:RluA family pseudouridine synthase [Paenibacillus sp. YX.27]
MTKSNHRSSQPAAGKRTGPSDSRPQRKKPARTSPAPAGPKKRPPAPGAFRPAAPLVYTCGAADELLPFLLANLTGKGRNAVKGILARGQVSVNGRAVTAYNHPLRSGDTVTVDREKQEPAPVLSGLSILHEDDDIIVIDKEAGLLSMSAGDDTEPTAYRLLTEHVRASNPKARIFIVHRLDRDTSGVMMFAKSERVQQLLQNSWKESVKERTYVALVEGAVKRPEGRIESWLKETSTLKMYSVPHQGDGQHAVTHYKLLQSNRHFSLLQVNLETGRKNQIRVHMSDIGHPVAGDKKYGAVTKTAGRLGLHARALSFVHPSSGELLTFESPVPKAFLKYSAPDSAARS